MHKLTKNKKILKRKKKKNTYKKKNIQFNASLNLEKHFNKEIKQIKKGRIK